MTQSLNALGIGAKDFVKESLESSSTYLSKYLLQYFDIYAGVCYAVVSNSDVQFKNFSCKEFSYGRRFPRIQGLRKMQIIIDHFIEEGLISVMGNESSRSTDLGLEDYKSDIIVYGTEVYHILGRSPRDTELTLREAETWMVVGIITRTTLPVDIKFFEKKHLEDMTANTRYIFVSAFDNEGYILWKKPE